MNRKSPSCKSNRSGRALNEYDTKAEAKAAARHANQHFAGNDLVPYKCRVCGFWHLSPKDRQTPSETCSKCRGADGTLKAAYTTENDARMRSKHVQKEQGVRLHVYQCEYGNGWHLTKQQR